MVAYPRILWLQSRLYYLSAHAVSRLTSIVRDDVDPVQLRKSLRRHCQQHPPFVLAVHCRIRATLAESALAQDLVLDLAELGFGVGVVDVAIVEVGEDAEAFGVFVGVDEPSERGEG